MLSIVCPTIIFDHLDELLETAYGPKKAKKYQKPGYKSGKEYNQFKGRFKKAQSKVERKRFRDRKTMMYYEKERKKMQLGMGQDPYLDTTNGGRNRNE